MYIPIFLIDIHHKQFLLAGSNCIFSSIFFILSTVQYTNTPAIWLAFIFVIVDFYILLLVIFAVLCILNNTLLRFYCIPHKAQ